MTLSILPTAGDIRTNAAFEELMWALARPGLERRLPTAGFRAIAETLIDRECTFQAADDVALSELLMLTGGKPAAIENTDYVFAPLATAEDVAMLSGLRIGTLACPDEAATLFASARFGAGQALRLIGPGIRGSLTIRIDGVHPSFWRMRASSIHYPLGWDLYVLDGDRLIGIPRSTKIEVL